MSSAPTAPSITTKLNSWIQWFDSQTSTLEAKTTNNFMNAGLRQNRFVGAYMAIPAIFASGIMTVVNPIEGAFKGAILITQNDFINAKIEFKGGLLRTVHSVYNIFHVFSTATVGLIARDLMYSNMSINKPSKLEPVVDADLVEEQLNTAFAGMSYLLAQQPPLVGSNTNTKAYQIYSEFRTVGAKYLQAYNELEKAHKQNVKFIEESTAIDTAAKQNQIEEAMRLFGENQTALRAELLNDTTAIVNRLIEENTLLTTKQDPHLQASLDAAMRELEQKSQRIQDLETQLTAALDPNQNGVNDQLNAKTRAETFLRDAKNQHARAISELQGLLEQKTKESTTIANELAQAKNENGQLENDLQTQQQKVEELTQKATEQEKELQEANTLVEQLRGKLEEPKTPVVNEASAAEVTTT